MHNVTIELHATTSKYWGKLEFVDSSTKLHTRAIEAENSDTINSNAIQATIAALRVLKRPCILDIHTDNEYVASSIVNGWAAAWKKNDWINAKGKTVKHKEQWKELMELLANHSYRFTII